MTLWGEELCQVLEHCNGKPTANRALKKIYLWPSGDHFEDNPYHYLLNLIRLILELVYQRKHVGQFSEQQTKSADQSNWQGNEDRKANIRILWE